VLKFIGFALLPDIKLIQFIIQVIIKTESAAMLSAALKEHQAQQAQAKRDLGMRHRKDI
jgi:hypothetical protein